MNALDLQRIHQAPMLEWQVFEALTDLGLLCDQLPEEERCAEQVKDKNWDPVRLSARPAGCYNAPPCWRRTMPPPWNPRCARNQHSHTPHPSDCSPSSTFRLSRLIP